MGMNLHDSSLPRAAGLIAHAKSLVALTGAGVSAGSGIPTYRGAGGVWSRYDPNLSASIDYFQRDPSYYWRFFKEVRLPTLDKARPNAAHRALVDLETRGLLDTVITQNIDGLHQEAGSRAVLELHGNTRRFYCQACGAPLTLEEIRPLVTQALPPPCPACGGGLRPDVVLFGERLREAVLRESLEAARNADVMLVVGSSLVVHPAASLPVITMDHGGQVILINQGETPLDPIAAVTMDADASEALPAILAALPPPA